MYNLDLRVCNWRSDYKGRLRFYFDMTQLVHDFNRARLHEGITYAISRQRSNLCGISRCPIKSSGAFFSLMEQNFDNNTHGPLVQSAHQRVYP